ncbi:MAG: membrane protein insertion efficiency factor YidD [Flavobacterium sp.]
MKYLLLLVIKTYWFLIPPNKRRKCIFRKSCSNAVYDDTISFGFYKGTQTLLFRIRNCNNHFDIITDTPSNEKKMYLKSGTIISETEIAERLL